jgi:hypothetical protein
MMDFPFFRVSTRSGFGVLVSTSLTLAAIIIQFLSVSSPYSFGLGVARVVIL